MVAVIHEVGGGGHLDLGARNDRAVDNRLQQLAERFPGMRNDAMFLLEPFEHQRQIGAMLRQVHERDVFPRVVDLVRVIPQVGDDVQHQLVVGLLTRVKDVDLLVQQGEKAAKIPVFRVPRGDRVCHRNSCNYQERHQSKRPGKGLS